MVDRFLSTRVLQLEKTNMLGLRERMEENGSAPGTGEAKRSAAAPADPEVVDRPLRRRFSPSYKLRIVEAEPGTCQRQWDTLRD